MWGLLACLLLGREVDGHVNQLPATRGSSPVRTLVSDNGQLANALTSVYSQCLADPRYRLHLHARDVLPLLLSMASTDSRFLLSTVTTSTSAPASALLRHFADFMAVLVRDCEEARQYAAHGNGVLMEQFAIALLVHEQAVTPRDAIPQTVAEHANHTDDGVEQNGLTVEMRDVNAAEHDATLASVEQHDQVAHSNGIHVEADKVDAGERPAEPAEQQRSESATDKQLLTDKLPNGHTPAQQSPSATDTAEVTARPTLPTESSTQTPTSAAPAATDTEQQPAGQQQDSSELPQPAEPSNGHDSVEQRTQKEQLTMHGKEKPVVHDNPADHDIEEPQVAVEQQAPALPAANHHTPAPNESETTNAQPSEQSNHLDADTPLTPSPPLASRALSASSQHSPFSSTAIRDMDDSSASIADDELSFSHSGMEQPGHRRGGNKGSLAEELLEADEEEQQEEEAEAMRRYEEYQQEERRMALMEAERQAAEERRLQQEKEEAERRARVEEEARQRQREAEEQRLREEEEEHQRLQRLEEEAEAEVAAEAALEEEEERKQREEQLERERKKQEAQMEQERAAKEEKLRKMKAAEEEKKRFELEVPVTVSPIPFDDAASQAVHAFLSQLLLLSLASPRPHVDSGSSSELPVLHTRLDTGVEDYIVKTPHPSSTSDGRSFAFSLLFDMLHFPIPPPIAAWLSASVPAVHRQYCSQLLKMIAQQLLSSSDNFSALVLSSSAFSHNFAQVLYMLLSEVRCGEWRGEGVQVILRLLGGWLRTPRFLSLLSAASAPASSQGKKVPDDGRRSAKVALAVVHSILIVQYAAALGLLARFVHPLNSANASSLNRRGKRDMKLLEWCNEYVVQHKEPVLSVLMAREKHHAMVACLLYCLFVQLSEEDEHVCLTASTALSAMLSSSARSIPYVTSLLSGKQSFTSSASFTSIPPHQLPVLNIGLSLLHRGDVPNFLLWRRDSYAALAPALRSTLGTSMEQWKAAREQQLQRHSTEHSDELKRREEEWKRRAGKEEQERAEVAVRVRMLESSVKERRVKAEQDKKKEERKDKSINVRMQRKKLEMKKKEEEMREKREEELEKRKASRGITAAQWSAVANATQVDDSVEWKLKMPQAYQQQQQQSQQFPRMQ